MIYGKNIYDLTTTVGFKCLQAEIVWQRNENFGSDATRPRKKIFVLSDEKLFTVEAVTNYQNKRFCGISPEYIPEGTRIHFM